jgi:CHAD domain-containing protein/CYTH domain-containing protein
VSAAEGLAGAPAARGARWLALRQLAEARGALERLGEGADAEALHDYRVGIRRLRSTLRAYRPHLEESLRRGDLRELRSLAKSTGEARDGEVLIAWVRARRDALDEGEREGVEAYLRRQDELQGARVEELRERATADFPRRARRLSARLARYTVEVQKGAGGLAERPPLGAVAGALLAEHGRTLRDALAAVQLPAEQEEAHAARMEAKRLRYLAEPFASAFPEAREVVRALKRLQDLLGEMRDAHFAAGLLAAAAAGEASAAEGGHPEPDPRPGLLALATLARRETERLFRRASREWLGERARTPLARIDALARRLAAAGADREIERKYLLRAMPRLPAGAVRSDLVQGWLPGERLQERVRRVRTPGEEVRHFRTVKLGRGISRIEVEETCDEATFRRLWRMTEGRRVRKLRYRVEEDGLAWEIDRFRGRRLFLAEVELPAEDAKVRIPAWLRPYVEREVTGEDEYVNRNLAG